MRRFHLYSIDKHCNLKERVTKVLNYEWQGYEYFNSCENVALVEIDEYGAMIGIVDWKWSAEFEDELKREKIFWNKYKNKIKNTKRR